MDTVELNRALEDLRERSRFRLVVHPDDAEAVRLAVIAAQVVGLVQVVEDLGVPRGDWTLVNSAAVLDQLGLNPELPTEEDDEMWWDGNMIGRKPEAQRNRTMLSWKLAGGKNVKRRGFVEPLSPKARASRSRHLAETFEGVPKRSDQELTSDWNRGMLRRPDGLPWLDFWRISRRR
jgi:hypothetical protein